MSQTLEERRGQEMDLTPSAGATARTSLITQLHPVVRGDRAVHDLLYLMAQTVAEFAALPEIRFIPTGSQSALALISALSPTRLDVKLTALATPVPETPDTALVIISAEITSESALQARGLADALLNTVPSTTVTRITTLTTPRSLADENALDANREAGAGQWENGATESQLPTGWSVIQ